MTPWASRGGPLWASLMPMPEFKVGQRVKFTELIIEGRVVGFGDEPPEPVKAPIMKCRAAGVLVEVGLLMAVVAPDVPNARGFFYRVPLDDLEHIEC